MCRGEKGSLAQESTSAQRQGLVAQPKAVLGIICGTWPTLSSFCFIIQAAVGRGALKDPILGYFLLEETNSWGNIRR